MGGISVFILLSILMSMFIVFVVVALVVFAYMLINYIFESVFLYAVSKANHYKYPITSWIPFYNKCILGKFADKQGLGKLLCGIDVLAFLLIITSKSFLTS